MSFFINDALAEGATATQGDTFSAMLLPIGLIVLFYFMLIRPQQKRAKEHKTLVAALQKGEEVVTSGGILGKIKKIDDNFVTLEISNDTFIHVQKHAIGAVMPKGTYKEQE